MFPDFLPETAWIRNSSWKCAPINADFQDRRVELTGPPMRKMLINAMNSGANGYMVDFEDASMPLPPLSPHLVLKYDSLPHLGEHDRGPDQHP